jgi:hypothetical protein
MSRFNWNFVINGRHCCHVHQISLYVFGRALRISRLKRTPVENYMHCCMDCAFSILLIPLFNLLPSPRQHQNWFYFLFNFNVTCLHPWTKRCRIGSVSVVIWSKFRTFWIHCSMARTSAQWFSTEPGERMRQDTCRMLLFLSMYI